MAHGHPPSLGVPSQRDGVNAQGKSPRCLRCPVHEGVGVKELRNMWVNQRLSAVVAIRTKCGWGLPTRSPGCSQLWQFLARTTKQKGVRWSLRSRKRKHKPWFHQCRSRSSTPRSSSSARRNGWCLQTSTISGHKSGRSSATRSCWRQKNVLQDCAWRSRGPRPLFPTQQRRCNVCSSLHRRKLNFSSTVAHQCQRVPQRNAHGDEMISCVHAPRRSSSGCRIGRWTSKRRSREAMRQRWPDCRVRWSKQRRVCNHSNLPWWRNLSQRQGVHLEWETCTVRCNVHNVWRRFANSAFFR